MHTTLSGLTDAEYRMIRDYLIQKTGLNLRDDKREELMTVVGARIAKEYPAGGFEEFFARLYKEGEGGAELRHLVSRLTVGETHFFRNRPQFEALKNHILPELVRARRRKGCTLNVWSAGCSTGEEPYSLAMLLQEVVSDLSAWKVTILATDINARALAVAKEGLYRKWSFRDVDEHYLLRYFEARKEGWGISREIADMVTFRYLNLADDTYPAMVTRTDEMDLILCRNVMIYFNVDLSRRITERFFRCLNEGGYLVVGHSEHTEMVSPKFCRTMFESAIVYRKETTGSYWERGLKPRFRGSGRPAKNLVTHDPSGFKREGGVQRPAETEETDFFEKAAAAYREMAFDEATAGFREVLRLNPRNERARYMLALLLANSGEIENAGAEVKELIDLKPLHLEGNYLLAMLHRVKGEGEEELAQLKRTVYISQSFVLGHFQMGVYFLRAGNETMARKSFLNVLQLLKGEDDGDWIDGVDGLTVGRLRQTVAGMMPGPLPEEFRNEQS